MRLSNQNLIACIGFAVMSGVATIAILDSKFLQPASVLFTAKTVTASVIGTPTASSSISSSRRGQVEVSGYQFEYEFSVDGKTHRGRSAADEAPAGTVEIQYLPSSPHVNGYALSGHAVVDLVIFAIPALALILSAGAVLLHVLHVDKVEVVTATEARNRLRR